MDNDGPTLLARYPAVPRRLLTVDDYHRIGEVGILTEDDRVELIEGELVEMAPIGSEHVASVGALTHLLVRALGERGIVFPQSPVRLDVHNEPQPDFVVVKPRPEGYRAALPSPEDVLVLIEVSASSSAYDRGLKLALYARHGIPEVWIVNVEAQQIEVFRKPTGDNYESSTRVDQSGLLEIEALPGVRIAADGSFG